MRKWVDHLVKTADGSWSIFHPSHQQLFHSESGARTEARDLYVLGSGIHQAYTSRDLVVADMGLGLGYNAMETFDAWYRHPDPGNLIVESFENDQSLVDMLLSPENVWQESLPSVWRELSNSMEITHANGKSKAVWKIQVVDLRTCSFNQLSSPFDFVWHDPFSVKENEDLWGEKYFNRLATVCKPGTVLMTYSVAGRVRRSLENSGFTVHKIATTTIKNHWLKATFLA